MKHPDSWHEGLQVAGNVFAGLARQVQNVTADIVLRSIRTHCGRNQVQRIQRVARLESSCSPLEQRCTERIARGSQQNAQCCPVSCFLHNCSLDRIHEIIKRCNWCRCWTGRPRGTRGTRGGHGRRSHKCVHWRPSARVAHVGKRESSRSRGSSGSRGTSRSRVFGGTRGSGVAHFLFRTKLLQ